MSQLDEFNKIVSEVFDIPIDQIVDDSTPDDIENWTSISHMDLIARFEEEFDLEFDVEEITEMDTIEAMKETLSDKDVDL